MLHYIVPMDEFTDEDVAAYKEYCWHQEECMDDDCAYCEEILAQEIALEVSELTLEDRWGPLY